MISLLLVWLSFISVLGRLKRSRSIASDSLLLHVYRSSTRMSQNFQWNVVKLYQCVRKIMSENEDEKKERTHQRFKRTNRSCIRQLIFFSPVVGIFHCVTPKVHRFCASLSLFAITLTKIIKPYALYGCNEQVNLAVENPTFEKKIILRGIWQPHKTMSANTKRQPASRALPHSHRERESSEWLTCF